METETDFRRRTENAVFASAFEKALNKEVLGEYTPEEKTRILKKYERTKQRKCNNAQRHNKRKKKK